MEEAGDDFFEGRIFDGHIFDGVAFEEDGEGF